MVGLWKIAVVTREVLQAFQGENIILCPYLLYCHMQPASRYVTIWQRFVDHTIHFKTETIASLRTRRPIETKTEVETVKTNEIENVKLSKTLKTGNIQLEISLKIEQKR